METSELTLLDLQNFLDSLKSHVRSEVEKYVDKRAEEVKNEVVTYIVYKVLNNMVSDKPLVTPKVDEPKTDKPERVVRNEYTRVQNREVIEALFIGKTLIGGRKRRGERYEVAVNNEGKFIYNGKKYNAPSTVGEEITGKNCDGWEFFEVCLNPEEGPRKLSYHRAKFLSAKINHN